MSEARVQSNQNLNAKISHTQSNEKHRKQSHKSIKSMHSVRHFALDSEMN